MSESGKYSCRGCVRRCYADESGVHVLASTEAGVILLSTIERIATRASVPALDSARRGGGAKAEGDAKSNRPR